MAATSKTSTRASKADETETETKDTEQETSTARKSRAKAPAPETEALDEDELQELFVSMLKDVYFAEKQVLKSLPKMAKAARSPALKEAFETHREETAGQIERLDKIFELVGERAKGEPCEAIQGILQEGQDVMAELKGKSVMDVGLVGSAKAVEHYEIARYSSMKTIAARLGMDDVVALIDENLAEETKTDELLDGLGAQALTEAA
jgi:ferritin-like metal-binding protein YciE